MINACPCEELDMHIRGDFFYWFYFVGGWQFSMSDDETQQIKKNKKPQTMRFL